MGHAPRRYDHAQALRVCEGLHRGKSLLAICRDAREDDPSFPHPSTIRDWYLRDCDNEFAEMYNRARRAQADHWAEEMIEIADDARNDYMIALSEKTGKELYRLNYECVQRSKLRIDTRKWMLAKVHPAQFAERVNIGQIGADGQLIDPPGTKPIDLAEQLKGWKPKTETE